MSKKRYEQLEILQDPEQQPKRKRKRKLGPVYIPWRWVGLSFAGGAALVILTLLALFGIRPAPLPVIPDAPLVGPVLTGIPPIEAPGNATPAPIPTLTGGGEFLRTLAWVNGRLAAAGSDTLRVYDDTISPGAAHWMLDYGQSVNRAFNTIALSPDGTQVAGIITLSYPNSNGGTSEIAVWDAQTGGLLRTFSAHIGGSPGFGMDAIAYSPDSTRMMTSAGDGRAIIWDAATGLELGALETGGVATLAMGFQPDSGHLVLVIQIDRGQAEVQTWDIDTQQQVRNLAVNRTDIYQVALSPDAAYMAMQEWTDADSFFISVWDIKRGEEIGTLPLSEHETIREIAIDTGLLALAGYVGAQVDEGSGQPSDSHTEMRALSWRVEKDGTFQYTLIGSKQDYLTQADIRELYFTVDDRSTWLNYITGVSGSNLQRWNIVTGVVEGLPFW